MKEQVIRSIGLVVSAAVLGGCLVWGAHVAAPHRYGSVSLTRQADFGNIGRYDRLAIVDYVNGTAEFAIGTGPIATTTEAPAGFVDKGPLTSTP